MKILKFFVKILLEIINFPPILLTILFFFRKTNRVKNIFIVYPANKKFSNSFCFSFRQKQIKWGPIFLIGLVIHKNSDVTLTFAISADEKDFSDSKNSEKIRIFYQESKNIADKFNATIRFAGRLPSIMKRLNISRKEVERSETVRIVSKCITDNLHEDLRGIEKYPIIILGSKGYIGGEISKALRERGINVIDIDVGDTFVPITGVHVVINITIPKAINMYIKYFTSNTILINEVYPVIQGETLNQLKQKGVKLFHIAGVAVKKAIPGFPGEYAGALPCCGASNDDTNIIISKIC